VSEAPSENTFIHLYRGELGRMTIYRVRLDTTTNWALGATVAVTTFALGQPDAPHVVLILPYALNALFAVIEARRFQDLELIRRRVRYLETGFFARQLGGIDAEGWQQPLIASLIDPRPPIPLAHALGERVRRTYLWLIVALYGAWLLKLSLSEASLYDAAAIGALSGSSVLGLGGLLLLPWLVLCLMPRDVARG
jgi:uncharacterized membrane protein